MTIVSWTGYVMSRNGRRRKQFYSLFSSKTIQWT